MREMFPRFATKRYHSSYMIKGKAGANQPFLNCYKSAVHHQKSRTQPPMMNACKRRFVRSASNG